MSVLIKSNNVLQNGGFGTVKMLGTTAQAQFDVYKARVLEDGGVIKDEGRTLRAFNMLFANKAYGNMNTAVSGTFGVKLDSNGGITKLYAIDGTDLIGTAYGTGTLPKLDADNNIDFTANSLTDNVNGGMFSTDNKLIVSKGNMGVQLRVKSWDTSIPSRFFHITKHNDVTNTQQIVGVSSNINGDVIFSVQTGTLQLTATPAITTAKANAPYYSYPPINFIVDADKDLVVGNRSGAEVTTAAAKAIAELKTQDFYLDFGGQFASDKKYFAKAVIRDMFCFAHASRTQATALSTFS